MCLVGGIAFGMGFRGAPAFDDFYAFPFFVALCAFLSLFLGREYGDGTLRNKVTAGYRRGQIYLAYLLASLAVGLLFLAAFLLPFVVMNAAALAPLGAKVLGPALVGMVLLCAALVALFTAISCCVSLWVVGALANLGLWFFLMFGAYQIEFALGQPAYVTEYYTDTQGREYEGTTPNPHYLGGTLRVVAEGVDACLPNGQMNRIVSISHHLPVLQETGLTRKGQNSIKRSGSGIPLRPLAVTAGSPQWDLPCSQERLEVREAKPCKIYFLPTLSPSPAQGLFRRPCSWWSTPWRRPWACTARGQCGGDGSSPSCLRVVLAAFCTLYLGTGIPRRHHPQQGGGRGLPGQIYGAYLLACLSG